MEDYNKHKESLIIDCGCKEKQPKPEPKKDCCGGCDLHEEDNTLPLQIRQLQIEMNKLKKDTQQELLCMDKKISETCVYIKTNLSNYIRILLEGMQESGELTEIIKSIILTEVDEIPVTIEEIENRINNLETTTETQSGDIEILQGQTRNLGETTASLQEQINNIDNQ